MLELRHMDETEIKKLYENSMSRDFPSSELKSLSSILMMYHRGVYDVLSAYLNHCFVGYALLYRPQNERVALLDYLAIEPEHRFKGIGSLLLKQLRCHYAKDADVLLIECERPNAAPNETEARKRIQFYMQSGAVLTSVRIWLFGVEYSILVLPCSSHIPATNWAEEMLSLYRQMLPEKLYQENVRLIRS